MSFTTNRGAAIAALLATTALAAPAFAQAGPPTPVRETIDSNGIDLFRGTLAADETIVSIGQDQGLAYVRSLRGNGWRDNITGSLWLNGTTMIASIGPVSDRFTLVSGTYHSTEGNGATLTFNSSTQIYTYTARDGTVATFDRNLRRGDFHYYNEGRVKQVLRPDGERLDFVYQTTPYCEYWEGDFCAGGWKTAYRLASVTNAYGYRMSLAYAFDELYDAGSLMGWDEPTGGKLVNLAVESCHAVLPNCATSQTWPGWGALAHTSLSTANGYVTDGNGRVTGIRRQGSASNDVTLSYSGAGRVSSVANHGGTWTYGTSDSGGTRTVTVTNPLSQTTSYAFTIASERLASVTDPLGRTTSYLYDTSGRVTRITLPEGNYTQFSYDARGNVTQVQRVAKPGSSDGTITTSAAFPASCSTPATCNQPTSTTDERGNVTDYSYYSHGGVNTVTLPAPSGGAVRPQTRYVYSSLTTASGVSVTRPTQVSQCQTQSSCAGTADEVKTSIGYTSGNILTASVSTGAGNGSITATSTMTWDNVGNLLTVDGPLPGTADTTRFRYDAIRRRIGVVGPDPDGGGPLKHRAQRFTYNTPGFVTMVESGTVNSQSDADWAAFASLDQLNVDYDADGRPWRQTMTSGGSTHSVQHLSYDPAGRPLCEATRMNPAAWGAHTNACTLQTAGAHGPDRITRNVYDAAGRVTQVQSAYGTADQANEVTATYRQNGQVETVTDGENNRTSYAYDGHDRLWRTYFPVPTRGANQSSTTDYEQLTYNAASSVTQRRVRDGQVIGFSYDNLNRVVHRDRPNAVWWETDHGFSYDNLNRLTGAWDSNGHALSFTYDALGRRLTESSNWYGAIATSAWDVAGRRTRLTWRDGFFVDYAYNVAGETTAIVENGSFTLATFAYDDLGRRTTLSRGNGTATDYNYDGASRLSSIVQNLAGTAHDLTLGFGYNPASQIASSTRSNAAYSWTGHYNVNRNYTANGLNQYTASGAIAPTYDARGNLTSAGAGSYGYTADNQLATAPGSNYAYDPVGRLFHESGPTSVLLYDGTNLIMETDTGGPVRRRYVHGPGVDEPLVWYEGSGTGDRRWLHADERGSIVAVANGSGNAIAINTYDEYGIPGATNIGRFQYTGQTWLPELGMYYYKARIYSPTLGRFLQTDPIGYEDGMNLYAYVGNDPVNLVDPSGLSQSPNADGGGGCTPLTGSRIACSRTAMLHHHLPARNGGGGGTWQCVRFCNNPHQAQGSGSTIIVFARPEWIWVSDVSQVASTLIGLTPVGTLFDVGTLLTGRDLITGERVSPVVAVAGLIPGVSEARKAARLLSPNQINRIIGRGQAPRGIVRVDVPRVRGEQLHVHVNGGALNIDGTWKHAPTGPLTNAQRDWLRGHGWRIPGE